MRYEYNLFFDDERFPGDKKTGPTLKWHIARNLRDAQWYIENYGFPQFVSIDHDMGANAFSGMDFAKWLVEQDMNAFPNTVVPEGFTYYVHSQNPVGAQNIQKYLDGYFKDRA